MGPLPVGRTVEDEAKQASAAEQRLWTNKMRQTSGSGQEKTQETRSGVVNLVLYGTKREEEVKIGSV